MHHPSQLQPLIEQAISALAYPGQPERLYLPIRYIMNLGGKRIRPVMVLMASELFHPDIQRSMDVALAVETFHNFTLVHDDIMDNAPLRRGAPTVHEKWGVNNAILSGDVMMVESNKHLSKVRVEVLKPVLDTFNATAQGVCEGQQLDMEFEARTDVSIAEYIEMIRLKTAVLLGGAMKLGAITGGANALNADLLYHFGENLGIAFQLQDDLLDAFGSPEKFGKQVGGDILAGKKTYLYLKTAEIATEEERFTLNAPLPPAEKIAAVIDLYQRYQIRESTLHLMNAYLEKAIAALQAVEVPDEKKEAFRNLVKEILHREN